MAPGRAGLAVLAVLGGTALALRAADAIPGFLLSVPRGVHVCGSLAEAESRTGLRLEALPRGLGDYQPVAGTIRTMAKPAPAVAVTLRGGTGTETELTIFRGRGREISALLRPPLSAFHEIEIPIGPGRMASLKAASTANGPVLQDLQWFDGEVTTALRFSGRTVELLRLARRIVGDAQ